MGDETNSTQVKVSSAPKLCLPLRASPRTSVTVALHNSREGGPCRRGDKGTGLAKRAGAWRRCARCLSLSWRQEDSAHVLGTGNYALILGFLHHHQLRSLGQPPRGIRSAKQIDMYFVSDHWQRGWALARELEPRPSTVLRKHEASPACRPQVEGRRTEGQRLHVCMGPPEAPERLSKVTQQVGGAAPGTQAPSPPCPGAPRAGLCRMDIILG